MGKIKNPATISSEFGIDEAKLASFGVVNVLLEVDTLLFIDPMLLCESKHLEMKHGANQAYKKRFEDIIRLLSKSKFKDDAFWKAAKKLFKFSEISWTCLGYGTSVKGSGFGPDLVEQTIDTASQIVSLGVEDSDLFLALALFEEGIGPDRISDMTTNIIIDSLIEFTRRSAKELNLPLQDFNINGRKFSSVKNPLSGEPLVLVPTDIVRDLPIASDWSDISRVVRENEDLRDRVNSSVGAIFATMKKKDKARLKARALSSKEAFEDVMDMLHSVDKNPYDFNHDHNGEVFWVGLIERVYKDYSINESKYKNKKLNKDQVYEVVKDIVNSFSDVVENKGLWKELWDDSGVARKEKAAQRLLFAFAISYCRANNLDITPEADAGNGPVDFKISQGNDAKVVIEIKLSSNPRLVHGYEKQLEIYKKADDTNLGIFLIVDIGGLGKKLSEVLRRKNEFIEANGTASEVIVVDGNKKESASKRH